MKSILIISLVLLLAGTALAKLKPDSTVIYKTIGDVELAMNIFFPKDHDMDDKTPAIVFFHGGGWKGGGPDHFYGQCQYLASRGIVTMSAQYRTENANGTTPVECVKDGKSAMRWVYLNAAKFGIDKDKIIAGGGSAGGHVAAATATVKGFNEAGEDTTISCRPKALVLFNPVANNGPEGYGYNRVKDFYKEFSPYHNLDKNTPPNLIMLGTEDKLFKPALAKSYKEKMEELGLRCDLILYEGQDHAFFNKGISTEMHYQTMLDADAFLCSLAYLKGKPATMAEMHERYTKKPNLLIIHTDEHNLRTLGCYRNTMSDEQALMWGKETIVETPHLDRLAKEGLLCENWYATSPVCTPSRASMISGLYPIATGSHKNDLPLKDELVSFAQILKENGYATSYVGKWHLDGDAKPGFKPARQFGFDDNRYMFNRGHWKTLGEDENGPKVLDKKNSKGFAAYDPEIANEESFTTDFLVDRSIEIIERDKSKPFALMLSIPDPHGPNHVRAPYDTMYTHLFFEDPRTMHPDEKNVPGWHNLKGKKNRAMTLKQEQMAQYFGMVKCIDDNVGRLMTYLKTNGLGENTIVVFTSDHGDLMGEHGKHNKGLPYEMSARVPFILKYPGHVKAKKHIRKAYTMADFTPTILGLMNVDHSAQTFHGMDASADFKGSEKVLSEDRIVYMTNAASRWVAAVNNQYKLVLSPTDKPWLFDLEKDPDEVINFYNKLEYKDIADRLTKELYRQMELYQEPLLKEGTIK